MIRWEINYNKYINLNAETDWEELRASVEINSRGYSIFVKQYKSSIKWVDIFSREVHIWMQKSIIIYCV